MRSLRISFLIALALGSACTPGRNAARDAEAVRALVHARLAAALTGDTATWRRQVADECVWTGPGLRNATTREVLVSVAANRILAPAAQEILDLDVRITGDVAQATYVQRVLEADPAAGPGKRFRKTDTYWRRGATWTLIGAAEVAIPFRPRRVLAPSVATGLCGRYAFGERDTLTLERLGEGAFVLRGNDGVADTLAAENDTTLFADGDPGSWILRRSAFGPARALIYRAEGSRDVVLPRAN